MKFVRAFFLGSMGAFLGLMACEENHSDEGDRFTRGTDMGATCAQAVSCLTCTPITGCGWCQLPDGTGRCVVDPNDCEGEKVFTWTWDPEGCRVPLDASSVSTGTPPSHDGGAAHDAGADAPDAD